MPTDPHTRSHKSGSPGFFSGLFMVPFLLWSVFSFLVPENAGAQEAKLKVQMSGEWVYPGDTLFLEASYTLGDRKLPPATFMITMQDTGDRVWQMRWPLMDGKAECAIVLPDSMPPGAYNLMYAIQPRFFAIFGEVYQPGKEKQVGVWLTANDKEERFEIPLDAAGRFSLANVWFEGEGFTGFYWISKKNTTETLVKLDTWLDSSFTPVAYAVKQIIVRDRASADSTKPVLLDKQAFFQNDFSCFESNYTRRLKMKKLGNIPAAALFDSLYVSNPVKALATRSFDLLADTLRMPPDAPLYDFLKEQLPGMDVEEVDLARLRKESDALESEWEWLIRWKGQYYRIANNGKFGAHYKLVDPLGNFATIKIVPPPGKGSGTGIIAFYEKQFPFAPFFPYRSLYTIRGYMPSVYALPLMPDR